MKQTILDRPTRRLLLPHNPRERNHHQPLRPLVPEFEEVEDALLQITHREATWGGMLSSTTPSAVPSSASAATNGSDDNGTGNGGGGGGSSSANGRTAGSKGSGREAGEGLIVGLGSLNGGAGGDILPETRTLV